MTIELGIGTVQLGLPYGAHAHDALMSQNEANEILKTASQFDINFLDTARQYGESEARIGQFLQTNPTKQFFVATKPAVISSDYWLNESKLRSLLRSEIEESRTLLGLKQLPLLLLHQSELAFLQSPYLTKIMLEVIEEGLIQAAGVSVYELEDAYIALELPWISWLQCPLNLIDQRFINKEFLRKVSQHNVRLIARTILLQGVLSNNAPLPKVRREPELAALRTTLFNTFEGMDLTALAISFVFGNCREIFNVGILGIQSADEIVHNYNLIKSCVPLSPDQLRSIETIQRQSFETGIYDPRPQSWNARVSQELK